MKRPLRQPDPFKVIARHLQLQRKLIEEANGSQELVAAMSALSAYLLRTSQREIESLLATEKAAKSLSYGLDDVTQMSLTDVERHAKDEHTARRTLEKIATQRFHVPSGSMRSFQTVGVLREKLLSLIENERTHAVISETAKKSRT